MRHDRSGDRGSGHVGFQIVGLVVFLSGFGLGIGSLAKFIADEGPELPALESQRPIYDDADPFLALGLVFVGVILIALGSGRRS